MSVEKGYVGGYDERRSEVGRGHRKNGEDASEIERLRAAMTAARGLIGAINDNATPAVKASNINMAWHVLDDNLRGDEQRKEALGFEAAR